MLLDDGRGLPLRDEVDQVRSLSIDAPHSSSLLSLNKEYYVLSIAELRAESVNVRRL